MEDLRKDGLCAAGLTLADLDQTTSSYVPVEELFFSAPKPFSLKISSKRKGSQLLERKPAPSVAFDWLPKTFFPNQPRRSENHKKSSEADPK